MAATTPGGLSDVAGHEASLLKEAASSVRCSSSMWAATSGAPLAQSSAASASACEMPRDCRRLAIPLVRRTTRAVTSVARVSAPDCGGSAPTDGVGRTVWRVARTVTIGAARVWPLPWLLSSIPLVRTDIGVDPSNCFRIRAGLRQVGHRVASCIVRAQRSKQAA